MPCRACLCGCLLCLLCVHVCTCALVRRPAIICSGADGCVWCLPLVRPTPRSAGVVECYIHRFKSGMNKLFPGMWGGALCCLLLCCLPLDLQSHFRVRCACGWGAVYHVFMKDGDRFLMAAKKRSKQRTSNYLISSNKDDMSKGANFMGKLRCVLFLLHLYVVTFGFV